MKYLKTVLIMIILLPLSGEAFFGNLGRSQCGYRQESFRSYKSDDQHNRSLVVRELLRQKQRNDRALNIINNRVQRLQKDIRQMFLKPWSEAMLAHMDNGYDCCHSRAVAGNSLQTNRSPSSEVTIGPAVTSGPPVIVAQPNNTCNGYHEKYCAQGWGRGKQAIPPRGAKQCIQTGFSGTPAWFYGACGNNGQINPRACSNVQIARNPQNYQYCMQWVGEYRKLSIEKRRLASMNQDIIFRAQSLESPNRPPPQYSKQAKGSSWGNVLGSILSIAAPIALNMYSAKLQRNNKKRYRRSTVQRRRFGAVQRSRPPRGATYTPSYGYGFGSSGSYGQIIPGLLAGAFGCSRGSGASGISLIASLLTGGNRRDPRARYGSFGGHAPYYAYRRAYGNRGPFIEQSRLGVRQGPYLAGGVRPRNSFVSNPAQSYYNSLSSGDCRVADYYSGRCRRQNTNSFSYRPPYSALRRSPQRRQNYSSVFREDRVNRDAYYYRQRMEADRRAQILRQEENEYFYRSNNLQQQLDVLNQTGTLFSNGSNAGVQINLGLPALSNNVGYNGY